ncbi:GGDEF domain-containing protein [Pseudomonas sp. Gutcm_11s]|uniref:GGDEF domain-containing protein n=1 Tax=Pseudomonas sp. Gutcm_11s TaxID=3026088 RepID=UPI00235EBDA9|nr:GGDEF domain-containing protein [Pseudomonas sp. Gutcm_11s]MDD0843911.1 GGDEF domain-containing protein [Pseudomonas sp. Gutcm_11s]
MISEAAFSEDSQQQLRIRRFMMSVAMYVLASVPQGVSLYNGISPAWVMLVWAAIAVVTNLVFYLLFRFGLNLRFRDPSLTLPQMVAAIAMVLFTQSYAGEARGAYLVVLLIIMVFGCFKLHTRELLGLSLATIVAYGMTLPFIQKVDGEDFNLAVEVVLWCSFSVFLPFISILGGSISDLRKRLMASNGQLQEVLQQVTELATHDELTGAYNRRYLLEMLNHEKNRTDRGGAGFCVCILDLDYFKRINDTYGHPVGDEVLKTFANVVQPLLRSTDFFARYGGEEFLLFLPQTSLEMAQHCIKRIQDALAETGFAGLPGEVRVTASIGVAQYYLQESVAALIERADKALYRAKQNGRNRMELAPFHKPILI